MSCCLNAFTLTFASRYLPSSVCSRRNNDVLWAQTRVRTFKELSNAVTFLPGIEQWLRHVARENVFRCAGPAQLQVEP